MHVEITGWAKSQLQKIYKHYSKEVSSKKAKEIVDQIVVRALSLEQFSERGKIDEDLRVLNKGHRFILERHYRIIYRVEVESIFVTDIFSNWQNPKKKLKRNK